MVLGLGPVAGVILAAPPPPRHKAFMATAALVPALTMTAIFALRYLVSSGLFAWITRTLHPGLYRGIGRQIGARSAGR